MNRPTRTRSRAIRVFFVFIAALGLLALLMSSGIWWLDVAYVSVAMAVLFVFSLRAVIAKWRSDSTKDITKHGPTAAYPESWRRWLMDDYPDDKEKHL